jgi:hypothetical protein
MLPVDHVMELHKLVFESIPLRQNQGTKLEEDLAAQFALKGAKRRDGAV